MTLSPIAFLIKRELVIIWRFTKSDLKGVMIPGLLSTFTAWLYYHQPLRLLPAHLLCSAAYSLLLLLAVNVANQVNSIEEDKLNKPFRPLPAGIISKRGAWIRMAVYQALFIAASIALGVAWYSLCWLGLVTLVNLYGNKHWFIKNVVSITLAMLVILGANWRIAGAPDREAWLYIALISCWLGCGYTLQDMRDQEGDRIMGRKTLPLDIGDRNARLWLGVYFAVISPVIYPLVMLLFGDAGITAGAPFWIVLLTGAVLHWWIVIRLWRYTTPAGDHRTYTSFVYLGWLTIPLIGFIT